MGITTLAVYAYYNRLSARKRATYRRSDEIDNILIPDAIKLRPLVDSLEECLLADDKKVIQKTLQLITGEIVRQLEVPVVTIKVLAVRPSNNRGELHGLYEPGENNKKACISLWMRTAKYKKVVAFRTFLRTYLHELCHHLDYENWKILFIQKGSLKGNQPCLNSWLPDEQKF